MATNKGIKIGVAAAIVFVILVIGLAIGLGLGLHKKNREPCTDSDPSPSIEGHYKHAVVASDVGECSEVGKKILEEDGGTAVDGAIAALLCACVQNSYSCGIGGGFFMTIYNRTNNAVHAIVAREMAPGAAYENMYVPPGKSSLEGGLSIGIPGEIKGLYEAWKIGGRLPWKTLFEPSIKLLKNGVVVKKPLAKAILNDTSAYDRHPNLKNTFTNPKTGEYYKEGDIIKYPLLAKTFETIANEGPDAFYNGSLTERIVADIQEAGGFITKEDLNRYTAAVTNPVMIKLRDNSTLYSIPPPSSGVIYGLILNILDEYKFDKDSMSTPETAKVTWHRIIEAFKFAFAKRTELGDGNGENREFRDNLQKLLAKLTSEEFAQEIRSKIEDDGTHSMEYYGPTFYDAAGTGTAQLSVLDTDGNAVSATSTINLYFGSKVVGSRTGIIFNDDMDDFSTPNTTNYFGVPASPANFIKPYKMPLSSMCPSIVVAPDGHVTLVLGAAGGTRIITATALVTMETLWFGMGIKEAVDYRRLHHQLLPPEVLAEEGFPQCILDGLRSRGHNVTVKNKRSNIQAILQKMDGEITANCDFRKLGYPDGY